MTTAAKKKVLLKIIILGDSGVGKTALLHNYIHQEFIQEHKATIGADFVTKEITIEDKNVTLQIWDTAGQERFQSLGAAFYRGADACIIVYDITNAQSFKNVEMWHSNFIEQANADKKNFPFLLCGNKADLNAQRAVATNDASKFAKEYFMKFHETSALNGNNVESAFLELATTASNGDDVPWFSPEVANKINIVEGGGKVKPEPPCLC